MRKWSKEEGKGSQGKGSGLFKLTNKSIKYMNYTRKFGHTIH